MSTLRSDSPLSKRIVRSFLRFLNSVEITPEANSEAVVVASQCLGDAFGVDVSGSQDSIEPDLVKIFKQSGFETDHSVARGFSEPSNLVDAVAGPSQPLENASKAPDSEADGLEKRLYEQFREGLESAGCFDGLSGNTSEFEAVLERSKTVFSEALKKVAKPGVSEQVILAEAFKTQGNTSMTSSHFNEAIDLYTMAISLCADNPVYYSNRAAAHTQAAKYEAAIADSNKAIQLDPTYSKAYSRLGLAYYTQGKYEEAIEKGFKKAHELDPNSKSIQENLLVAQKKLDEERAHIKQENSEKNEQQPQAQSSNQGSETRYSTTIPFDVQFPQEMAGLFPAVANLAAQFAGGHTGSSENDMTGLHVDGQPPNVRMDGNMNVTVEGNPQFAGIMQSMLQMFGAGSNQNRNEPPNQNPSERNHVDGQ